MAIQTLPLEIISDILSRLPVKPLCRFKCVSKPWNSLINSSNFIKLHLTKTLSSDNHPNLIFSSFSLSSASIDSIIRFTELHHPLLHFPDCFAITILGSCNGVVCIAPFDKVYTCLYNPSTKTHRLLPPAPSRFPNPDRKTMFLKNPKSEVHVTVYGFGYDSDNDDYKLLRMLEYYKDSVFVAREACLYSLRNGSWKYVSDDDDVTCGFQYGEGALVDEVLYFVADNNYKRKPVIKCFNLWTETFSLVDFPNYDENFDMFHFGLREVGGCLYMMLNYQNNDYDALNGYRLVHADLWVMKDYWVRLFSISDPASIGASSNIKPLVFAKDGRRILIELDSLSFGWYDWESKKFVRVSAHGLPPGNTPFDTWTFVGSPVSLGKATDNSKGKTALGKANDNSKGKTVPNKKNKNDVDSFLSSGFKLKL